jgi:mannose-6-phosphate isomerase-like protein (cupin superfamily)
MHAKHVTPILNVSDIKQSFDWFARLGWQKCWDFGDPPTFGSVGSGECEIFLCLDGQGGRGREGGFGGEGMGVWMSIWVEDVDVIYERCKQEGIEVSMPPQDEPWGVREMHVRHPDGHVFRISKSAGGAAGKATMFVRQPTVIQAAGNLPKIIEEYIGRVNSQTVSLSIARMRSPAGWVEPGQTPDFDEFTVVLRGMLRVTTRTEVIDVAAGQAIITHCGHWVQYSTPGGEGAEYVAVCLPAFSPETVHRDAK